MPSGPGRGTMIPPQQMDLPVAFDASGNVLTLRQAIELGRGRALSFTALTPEQRAELTTKRIEAQPGFEVAMIGGGIVDKAGAIAAVKAQSDVGKVLMEIEERLILNLLDEAQRR